MGILIGIQLFIIVLLVVMGWLIRYKKMYGIISGFSARTDEEQQILIENGYPQKTGMLLFITGLGMLILMPLSFTAFSYIIEVQFGYMLLVLMLGSIYLVKFDLPQKRKKYYILHTGLFIVVAGFILVLSFMGYQQNKLVISDETFEITGMYGDAWKLEDISEIKLLNEMPEVKAKLNGFGTSSISKGLFKVEEYGNSLLFIQKGTPILYIKVNDKQLFLNSKSPEQTEQWYMELKKATSSD